VNRESKKMRKRGGEEEEGAQEGGDEAHRSPHLLMTDVYILFEGSA
jgi:hypothetical protein